MSQRGLYALTEKEQTSYFYSHTGGSATEAFALLAAVGEQDDVPFLALPADKQLARVDRTHTVNGDDRELLTPISESSGMALWESIGQNATVNAGITMDFDRNMVKVEHNPVCYRKLPMDFSIGMSDGIACYLHAQAEATAHGIGDVNGHIERRLPELIAEKLAEHRTEMEPVTGPGQEENASGVPPLEGPAEAENAQEPPGDPELGAEAAPGDATELPAEKQAEEDVEEPARHSDEAAPRTEDAPPPAALRPLQNGEARYFYGRPDDVLRPASLIGHMRADFGKSGKDFWHTWSDHNKSLVTAEYTEKMAAVINQLRKDGLLSDLPSMRGYCAQHPDAAMDQNEYGFHIEENGCDYFLRCITRENDYNLYMYCYDSQLLRQEQAQEAADLESIEQENEAAEAVDPEEGGGMELG